MLAHVLASLLVLFAPARGIGPTAEPTTARGFDRLPGFNTVVSAHADGVLGKNALDTRECCAGSIGNAAPTIGSRLADPVIEWLGPRSDCFSHNDSADHPCPFVRHAVVVIDPGDRERDVEGVARMHEESRVPRLSALWDPQRVIVVAWVVRSRRVHVFARDPAYRRTGLHIEPDWIEPDPSA